MMGENKDKKKLFKERDCRRRVVWVYFQVYSYETTFFALLPTNSSAHDPPLPANGGGE